MHNVHPCLKIPYELLARSGKEWSVLLDECEEK